LISYIKGQVEEIKDGLVVIDNGGMGYEAIVSSFTVTQARKNPYMQLYTYMSVSEAGLFLYGFYSKEEKDMFLKLITISGVGPKAAISILSGIDVNTLLITIFNQDVKTLSKVKGIGKKTAKDLVKRFRTLENLEKASFEELSSVDGIGDILANNIFQFFRNSNNVDFVNRHRDAARVEMLAADMARLLRQSFGDRVLGPDRPPVSKVQSLHIRKIMVKLEKRSSVSKVRDILVAVQSQIMAQPSASGLQICYDVDPV